MLRFTTYFKKLISEDLETFNFLFNDPLKMLNFDKFDNVSCRFAWMRILHVQ